MQAWTLPAVALRLELYNQLTRTWVHVKDLVWSRYRHRIGMCAAGVMWLPRTQPPPTMHSACPTSQSNYHAVSLDNLPMRNISQDHSELHSAFETQTQGVALLTAMIDRTAVRYTLALL